MRRIVLFEDEIPFFVILPFDKSQNLVYLVSIKTLEQGIGIRSSGFGMVIQSSPP